MRITLDLPEKYSDIITLTTIAAEPRSIFSAQVHMITRAIDIRGRDGQTRIIRADGSDEWETRQQEQTGDLVSRQEVLDIIDLYQSDIERGGYDTYSNIFDEIDRL